MVQNEVGDGSHLDFYQFYVAAFLVARGELERLEPVIYHLALQCIVIAFVQSRQLQCEGAVATECLDVRLTVGLTRIE